LEQKWLLLKFKKVTPTLVDSRPNSEEEEREKLIIMLEKD